MRPLVAYEDVRASLFSSCCLLLLGECPMEPARIPTGSGRDFFHATNNDILVAALMNPPRLVPETIAAPVSEAKPEPKPDPLVENRNEKSDLLRPEDLSVRDLRIAPTDRGIDVHFNLQNSGRLAKAQGYLSVIGEMALDSGEKIYVVAPEMPGFDPKSGKIEDFKRGESFAAARFRSSRMSLARPAGTQGRFTSVRIVLTDREGRIADETTKEVKLSDVAARAPAADGG